MKLSKHARKPAAFAVLTAMTAAFGISGSGAAATSPAPKDGRIAILATLNGGPSGKIVVAGSIGDWGTSVTVDKSGRRNPNGNFVRVTLRKGSFELDSTALQQQTNHPRPLVASDATCSVSARGSAPVRLFNGAGLYKGIAGRINATLTFSGVGRRYLSGPKKGQCEHGNQTPLTMLGTVIGEGSIHFH